MNRAFRILAMASVLLTASIASAQEQIDKADVRAKVSATLSRLSMRVRVTKTAPLQPAVRVDWRVGGEGLGGSVVRGSFTSEQKAPQIPLNAWSAWLPLKEICGGGKGWQFPSIVVTAEPEPAVGKKKPKPAAPLSDLSVDFEFAENGNAFRQFTEIAPKGATVGFAFPGGALGEKVTPDFASQLNGLSGHVRARRERLDKLFPEPAAMPKLFGVIGHVAGYGQGGEGKGGASGYGVRHNNPAILTDEFRTLRHLGVNGFVGSISLADAAGMGEQFRRIYWGGPGSGDPMAFFSKGRPASDMPEGCPFDPALKPFVKERTLVAIAEHKAVGAKDSWALWDDEMGVYAKEHIARCPRCETVFREYLKSHQIAPADVGAASWDQVKPFNLWPPAGTKKGDKSTTPPLPTTAGDSLRYYYTYRLMTHANGQVFPEAARLFADAGIKLYAMQGPTPSWNGSSLDWHEFYDAGANTAFVFETSNRDARSWQWESYLADIGRGIASRHKMPMGCLVKPHRGAPAQRMLSVVSRGTSVIEWYTYGPDYAKGDSFSQSPELLEQVAKSARFLGTAEPYLYGATMSPAPEVAFVSPRSAEIWSRATDPSLTTFENAKWVYLALRHAQIPLDILSEQQLIEGKLDRYKVIYVPGTHLHHLAGASVQKWVEAGGTLWTDAMGLSHDEANQPSAAMSQLLGLKGRTLESWGSVEQYRATEFKPLVETNPPAGAAFTWNNASLRAAIGREAMQVGEAEVLAKFADGKPAVTRHRMGKGEAIVAGIWSGIAYSNTVRRADFDMGKDFDATLRSLIAMPAISRKVSRPAVASDPLVETVALSKDGTRSIALMNWNYRHDPAGKGILQPAMNVRVDLADFGPIKSVRSLRKGALTLADRSATLPQLDEIDLLLID